VRLVLCSVDLFGRKEMAHGKARLVRMCMSSGIGIGNTCDPTHSLSIWHVPLRSCKLKYNHRFYSNVIPHIQISLLCSWASSRAADEGKFSILIFYSISITRGGHPLFATKGAQLTILIPVLVVFDSWYHHLVDLHFKLAAFIFSSCQATSH
jgi:hypothetical protein